jgi:hypothetical protein
MSVTILAHISGEDPVLGEIDELPNPSDTTITINNPRRRDEKDLPYLHETVVKVLWPMHRIMFLEVLPSKAEEELIGFVRE